MTPDEKIRTARLSFLIGAQKTQSEGNSTMAFFGHLMMRLPCYESDQIGTFATDGRVIYYNPKFAETLSVEHVKGVLAHEAMHVALLHVYRKGNRDHQLFNMANDLAINSQLLEAKVQLPECGIWCGQKGKPWETWPPDKPSEWYYEQLQKCVKVEYIDIGSVMPGDPSGEAETKQIVQGALDAGRRAGNMPGGIDRAITAVLNPKVDWRAVLRKFIESRAKNDYNWSHPNRRFIHMDVYLPGLLSQEIGHVLVGVDCSGSIGIDELNQFASEVQDVLECGTTKCTIMYHNVDVERTQEWEPTDGRLVLTPAPAGGTSHQDLFRKAKKLQPTPVCMICLTDLETDFPSEPPEFPVLWAQIGTSPITPPFGTHIKLDF
jgi:predicted metal-dependent peptidase